MQHTAACWLSLRQYSCAVDRDVLTKIHSHDQLVPGAKVSPGVTSHQAVSQERRERAWVAQNALPALRHQVFEVSDLVDMLRHLTIDLAATHSVSLSRAAVRRRGSRRLRSDRTTERQATYSASLSRAMHRACPGQLLAAICGGAAHGASRGTVRGLARKQGNAATGRRSAPCTRRGHGPEVAGGAALQAVEGVQRRLQIGRSQELEE